MPVISVPLNPCSFEGAHVLNKLAQRSTLTKVDEHVDIASACIAHAAAGMTADFFATRILLRDSQLCQGVVSGQDTVVGWHQAKCSQDSWSAHCLNYRNMFAFKKSHDL